MGCPWSLVEGNASEVMIDMTPGAFFFFSHEWEMGVSMEVRH